MNNLKILGWDKKPKTLYRYIKEGDIFAFQIKIDLFGFGRILAKNPLGVSAEIFDVFETNPDDFFRNKKYDRTTTLFVTILDAHSLFQEKLDTEWRIIAKDTNYDNPYADIYTSISPIMKIMHNPDFSKKMEITKEEAVSTIKQFPWKDEFPRHHYHMLELLIKCKPELFTLPLLNFMGFEKFILDTLSESKKIIK